MTGEPLGPDPAESEAQGGEPRIRPVQNPDIADALGNIADLLEIRGANSFRIRAYRNAVRTVETTASPLWRYVDEGRDLQALPAVGKDMAAYIEELVRTGRIVRLEELSREIPASLIELMRLPGVGPKRAKALWEELGVENVDGLEEAARTGRVAGLRGFGAKTQTLILESIAAYRRHLTRFLLSEADRLVQPLMAHMSQAPGLERIEAAGSYRRRRETVGDIDLLAIAAEAPPVMAHFVDYPQVTRVKKAGDTRGRVVLGSGLEVDLRIVGPRSYGAALQYFTGSKEHNIKLRRRAVADGLRISEYGVFRVDVGGSAENGGAPEDVGGAPEDVGDGAAEAVGDGAPEAVGDRAAEAVGDGAAEVVGDGAAESAAPERDPWSGEYVAGAEEADVYAAVGLPWIPPELREDRGEIEAAAADALPNLISLADIRGDLQMHSTWSDGRQTIEEMLLACVAKGYAYFAITDHSKALPMIGGLDRRRLEEQVAEIRELAGRYPQIRILASMEVDILRDGSLDLEDDLLAELDLVVVSIHSHFRLPADEQTERLIRAVGHPEVDVLAHPTARILNRRDPAQMDVEAVLRACAQSDVIVELNAHPHRLDLCDTHLVLAREMGLKVAISTDAHRVAELDNMRYGVEQARRAWLQASDVVNTWPLPALCTHLGLS